MKKLFVAFMMALLIVATMPSGDVHAYPGGLLNGKPMYIAKNNTDYNGTTTLATDGNESTFYNLPGFGPGAFNKLWYNFPYPYDITAYQLKGSPVINILYTDGTVKKLENVETDGTKVSITLMNVSAIGIENSTTSPISVYEFDVFGEKSDQTAPSPPSGLVATAGNGQATLTWTASPSADVKEYRIYRNNVFLASVQSPTTSYTATGLQNGYSYSFKVSAVDTSDNESTFSNTVNVIPKAPDPPPETKPLTVNFVPNGTSIIVQVTGGKKPYTVEWNSESETFNASTYYITGLELDTDYTITVTDADGEEVTQTVNTGSKIGYTPPVMPSPVEVFQRMIDSFGTAGAIAKSVLMAAVSLGVICILGLWGWRLSKRWLATSK